MKIQKRVFGEWVDYGRDHVVPELQVLLKQRLRDAQVVGYDPGDVITILETPGQPVSDAWRALP